MLVNRYMVTAFMQDTLMAILHACSACLLVILHSCSVVTLP